MKLSNFSLGMALILAPALSFATPHYTGDTFADLDTYPGLNTQTASTVDAGYYIWSDESKLNWSVRWTGNDHGDNTWDEWFGAVNVLSNNELTSVTSVAWDAHDAFIGSDADAVYGAVTSIYDLRAFDTIQWDAGAGWHWDGFDFTVASTTDYIDFHLGSTQFDGTGGCKTCNSSGIFIGLNDGSWNQPLVEITVDEKTGDVVQSFSVSVPEPAMLAVFGAGLIGFGFARKARKA